MKYGCLKFIRNTGMIVSGNVTISATLTEHTRCISVVCISTIGLIVAASYDGSVSIWCNITYKCLKKFGTKKSLVTSLCPLPDNRVAFATANIYILDLTTLKCEKILKGHSNSVTSMIDMTDVNKAFYSISSDRTLKLWNLESGEIIKNHEIYGHTSPLLCKLNIGLAFSADIENKQVLISGPNSKTIVMSSFIRSICKFGKGFACGYDDGTIDIYKDEGSIKKMSDAHKERVTCLIECKPEILISGSFDGSIKVWDIVSYGYNCIRTIYVHSNKVRSIALDHTKTSIISVGDDNTICITSLEESSRLEQDDIQLHSIPRISLFS
jgi:WD40 repeat protein